MTDIHHVTPITPNAALIDVCTGRDLLVSMYRPDQLATVLEIGRLIITDHGNFSTWIAAMKAAREWSEENVPSATYFKWLEPFIWRPNVKAIMPDIPGAPSQINDGQLLDWPFPVEKGMPVYHMDGPIARFGRLLEKYPRVCMGWIGDPKKEPVGCDAYWRRVEEIERELGLDVWQQTHMLRGVAVAFDRPFRRSRRQQPRPKRPSLRQPHGRVARRQVARASFLRRQAGEKA
ncbi:hypothetical protein [Caulobacter sp. RHG1]|uniref:hypothetical protein n=1 Tax=Caulobacter sp. (strain RHG1) TaxID=2545762 RepID=UPI001553ACDA|nr:hypothetical protein [Caulobacter sp. RHG1]NQE62902.1 hypothetical protein [Caulobacter sp. RHG1]